MDQNTFTKNELKEARFASYDIICIGGRYYRAWLPGCTEFYLKHAVAESLGRADGLAEVPCHADGLSEIQPPPGLKTASFEEALESAFDEVVADEVTVFLIDLFGWDDPGIPGIKRPVYDMQGAWLTTRRSGGEQAGRMAGALRDPWWFWICGQEKALELCRRFSEKMENAPFWSGQAASARDE